LAQPLPRSRATCAVTKREVLPRRGATRRRLDFSLNYNFSDKFTVFFDATNLTQDPFEVTFSSARDGAERAEYVRFLRYEETTLSLGVRFRL
jgi:hypothetical protein